MAGRWLGPLEGGGGGWHKASVSERGGGDLPLFQCLPGQRVSRIYLHRCTQPAGLAFWSNPSPLHFACTPLAIRCASKWRSKQQCAQRADAKVHKGRGPRRATSAALCPGPYHLRRASIGAREPADRQASDRP